MSLLAAWLLWGFVGTLVLTMTMVAGRTLGLTRMDLPYMLGTLLTPDRDRANVVGMLAHLAFGWLFALVYVAAFASWGAAGWWRAGPPEAGRILVPFSWASPASGVADASYIGWYPGDPPRPATVPLRAETHTKNPP